MRFKRFRAYCVFAFFSRSDRFFLLINHFCLRVFLYESLVNVDVILQRSQLYYCCYGQRLFATVVLAFASFNVRLVHDTA